MKRADGAELNQWDNWFKDDFAGYRNERPNYDPENKSTSDSTRDYVNGKLHIIVLPRYNVNKRDGGDGYYFKEGFLRDFFAETEAKLAGGPQDLAEYGLTFRRRKPGSLFRFLICESGYFTIMKLRDNSRTYLVDKKACSFIKSGETNKIAVRAAGDNFTFYVNKKEVACCTDATFVEGSVGIGYRVWAQMEFALDFFWFQVLAPTGPT